MSAVSLLTSLKEKSSNNNPKDGSNYEGDEEGLSARGGDPAVLAMGPARRPLTYTRSELLRLRNSPLVKRNLDNAFAGCEALALVLKKRSESPNDEDKGGRGDAPTENHKGVYGRDRERRSADPRERVRKESSPGAGGGGGVGIVLSPQRRSFTSGCGAPAAAAPPPPPHVARTRPESPLGAAPPHHHGGGGKQDAAGRRIGSGRIMVRDGWEEGEGREGREGREAREAREGREGREGREVRECRTEPYRPPRERERDRERDRDQRNGDRFERRSFNRDSYSSDIKREREDRFNNEKIRDREDNRRSGGRFSQRRFEKEDEPEWFSGGPTSQLETIELRGFDEPIKKSGSNNGKENEKWSSGDRKSPADRWREPSPAISSDAKTDAAANEKETAVETSKPEEPHLPDQPEFNLDEFLKFDTIPDVLTNGSGEGEGSRFSRWFRRESPTNDSRHYERLLHSMVDDLDKSSRVDPPTSTALGLNVAGANVGNAEAQHVFAPISPAAPRPPSLLDLLRQANAQAAPAHGMGPGPAALGGNKMQSLEELEARLRPQRPQHVPDHDLSAFKRLLAQVSGGHAVQAAAEVPRLPPQPQPQPQPQPMSLLQMLNKSMEQQQQQQQHAQQQQQQQQQQQKVQQPHIPQELLYKLLQVQRQQQHQQPVGEMNVHASDRELLQRPEAQALVHGLKAGEITVQHLMQQLSNPGLQSRHREVLLAIMRVHHQQRQMGGSPLPSVPGVSAPHLVVPPHHQPLRLSPLPHTAFCVSPIMPTSPNTLSVHHPGVPARIPSPRELAAHTQSIMQGALIKKKLEEQRENYRRRHEMQQPKQSTPISFTPTSVLRKMTAEKEGEAASPKQQQWSQPVKMPQGRPIVKGNQSGASSMAFGPSPSDYQQHYLSQQQMAGARQFAHQQQRQQIPNSYNSMGNMSRGASVGGATLQQLLAHSQHGRLNEMGGGIGGGDNQLARWFSPELLARASAGKLPSVHVPNALSLEDLERHHHSPAPPVRN